MCGHDWCSVRISKEIQEFARGKDAEYATRPREADARRSRPSSSEILEKRGVLSPEEIHRLARKTRKAVGADAGREGLLPQRLRRRRGGRAAPARRGQRPGHAGLRSESRARLPPPPVVGRQVCERALDEPDAVRRRGEVGLLPGRGISDVASPAAGTSSRASHRGSTGTALEHASVEADHPCLDPKHTGNGPVESQQLDRARRNRPAIFHRPTAWYRRATRGRSWSSERSERGMRASTASHEARTHGVAWLVTLGLALVLIPALAQDKEDTLETERQHRLLEWPQAEANDLSLRDFIRVVSMWSDDRTATIITLQDVMSDPCESPGPTSASRCFRFITSDAPTIIAG